MGLETFAKASDALRIEVQAGSRVLNQMSHNYSTWFNEQHNICVTLQEQYQGCKASCWQRSGSVGDHAQRHKYIS